MSNNCPAVGAEVKVVWLPQSGDCARSNVRVEVLGVTQSGGVWWRIKGKFAATYSWPEEWARMTGVSA